jgi:hypothetical protein
MGTKFDKYWKEVKLSVVLVIIIVLDLRKKGEYLDFFLEELCENFEHIQKAMDSLSKTMTMIYMKNRSREATSTRCPTKQGLMWDHSW